MQVHVLETGVANLASVCAAFRQLGCEPLTTRDPRQVRDAEFLVLPGVGSFAAGMRSLSLMGLVNPLRERVRRNQPTLGICLGLQLFCESSEESPGVPGIGSVPAIVTRLRHPQLPHMGWNAVGGDGQAYFANSYAVETSPEGWEAMTSRYGTKFCAALRRGRVLLCQFHPELSGGWGLNLLRSWLGQPLRPAPDGSPSDGLAIRVIPCLDVRQGRVVKGVNFQGLRDLGEPAVLAARYARQEADELVVLDIAATPQGLGHRLDVIRDIRARLALPLTVGGGVRSVKDAAALLGAGADKVAVNSAAVADPQLLLRLAEAFGRQCVVLAIDARRSSGPGWSVLTRSGARDERLDAVSWAAHGVSLGAGELLLTSWDRDGTGVGYDLELIAAMRQAISVPIIASGGGRSAAHMHRALQAGASAVLAASVLHDMRSTVPLLKQELRQLGQEIRP